MGPHNTQTHAERLAHLAQANAIRTARAQLKVWLAGDGPGLERAIRTLQAAAHAYPGAAQELEQELDAPPAFLASMTAVAFLRAVRGFGPVKAAKTLKAANITTTRRLGQLTPREAIAIYTAIQRRADQRVENATRRTP